MKSYQPSTPRAVLGLTAVAMSAITIGAMVVFPTTMDSAVSDQLTLAKATASTAAPIEVAISPARIDVIVVRESDVTWALTDAARPNCKPEG